MASTRPGRSAAGGLLKAFADNSDSGSLATRMRRARFRFFLSLLSRLSGRVGILDIGGTQEFWDLMGLDAALNVRVTLLNIEHQRVTSNRFVSAVGDARAMPQYRDKSFDVVFSNSVIEHVGDYSQQRLMAMETMRVGRRYFVQTPNRRFPLEPHFLFPWFQYLPSALRARMLNRFDLGWYKRIPDLAAARAEVDSIQLLTHSKLAALFPDASIHVERIAGFPKSFVAFGGWD